MILSTVIADINGALDAGADLPAPRAILQRCQASGATAAQVDSLLQKLRTATRDAERDDLLLDIVTTWCASHVRVWN